MLAERVMSSKETPAGSGAGRSAGKVSNREAACGLGLGVRQYRRLKAAYRWARVIHGILDWIERLWFDLHANVTRNHPCRSMDELMTNVNHYLQTRFDLVEVLAHAA